MSPSARFSLALFLAVGLAVPAAQSADGLSGPYLAARQAMLENDYQNAASYFGEALIHDNSNALLLENAIMADIAIGDFRTALPIAQRLLGLVGKKNATANLVILADELQHGNYEQALSDLNDGQTIGPLVDGLIKGWANVGAGRMSDGVAAFDKVAVAPGLQAFGLYHKALALASVGDFEGADAIFSGKSGGGQLRLNRRGVVAYAEVLSQLERNKDAIALLDQSFGTDPDPAVDPIRKKLQDGMVLPFDMVRDAKDGLSDVFYTVAAAVIGQASDSYTLTYARAAEFMRPGNVDTVLLCARLLEKQSQYALAIKAYDSISRDDPAFYAAQLGRANALYADGKYDAAIEAMRQLALAHPNLAEAQLNLGDLLRRQERFKEAVAAYDAAAALIHDPAKSDWGLFYMRGISYERLKIWDKAEADFREALKLEPDQPQVLNYLGYALVERNEKLPEALDMIQRAVKERPDDGYIVDSLAWVLYRTGRYAEALPNMEHASQLLPVDPVVTDHLGDVYWAVGRKLEAQFQWRRALSYKPDEKDAARIRRKLELGLDVVLKEEGAPPIKATDNGN